MAKNNLKNTISKLKQEISKQKLIKENLQYKVQFEGMINLLSNYLINLNLNEIDEGITNVLEIIGEYTDADRSFMFLLSDDCKYIENAYEWCSKDIKNRIIPNKGLSSKSFPWFMNKMMQFSTINISDVSDMPSQDKDEKEYLKSHSIKSHMSIPIVYVGKLSGVLGFETIESSKEWLKDTVVLLNIMSEIFISTIKRTKAEHDLTTEKERLDVTLSSIADGVVSINRNKNILLFNKAAQQISGYSSEEVIGRPFNTIFNILDIETRKSHSGLIDNTFASGIVTFNQHEVLKTKNGKEKIITSSTAPIIDKNDNVTGIVFVFRDITEMQRMEQEVLKAQKFESLGLLAGGLAHDFNNILTTILFSISISQNDRAIPSNTFKVLSYAKEACLKAKGLTKQLLTFSKGGTPIKVATSITEPIKCMADFFLRGSNIKCNFSIPDDLWTVDIDMDQISQVIQNMILNSQQAMPKGGIIDFSAKNITIKENEHSKLPLKPGKYVNIEFKDYGMGIPKENLERIYDPYFTTKDEGSGLGLTIVYSIIKKHNGYIAVSSKPNTFTTFNIYIPVSEKPISTGVQKAAEKKYPVFKGKILIMDDDELIRESLNRTLSDRGYKVEFAKDSIETIKLFKDARASKKPFDVIILDLTVPGSMGGKETLKKLLKIDSNVKAIASSGYSEDPVMSNFAEYGFKGIIAKPYELKDFNEVVYNVIEET